jgi:hypothetical protein
MNKLEDTLLEYLDEDIPTSPGGLALLPCCKWAHCELCEGSGWRMAMLRKLPKKDYRRE